MFRHSPWAPAEVPEAYREKLSYVSLSYVASEWGLEGKLPLSQCWALLLGRRETDTIYPVLSPPSHAQIWIFIRLVNPTYSTVVTPWDSTPPTLSTSRGLFAAGRQSSLAYTTAFFGQLSESVGLRQVEAGFGGLWDFHKWNIWIRWPGRLFHWVPKNTYYIRSPC